jgi:hypothetical protein
VCPRQKVSIVYAWGYHETRTCSSRSAVSTCRPSGASSSAVSTDVWPSTSAGGAGAGSGACRAYACTSPNLSPTRMVVPSEVRAMHVGFFGTSLRWHREMQEGGEGQDVVCTVC